MTTSQPRKTLHRVSVITASGHRITDTLTAYDAQDAARKARSMIRANHGTSYTTVLSVQTVGR